jgi:Cu/Ag efflux protein CusF
MSARVAVLMLSIGLFACEKKEPVKRYELHGQIIQIDEKEKLATIKHQKIGDWMGAMTMDFPVKDPKDFSALHVGDTIDGTVFVEGMNYWVGEVHTTPAQTK